jgi:hypothetical protein
VLHSQHWIRTPVPRFPMTQPSDNVASPRELAELMRALQFESTDLDSNRVGYLTEAQAARVLAMRRWNNRSNDSLKSAVKWGVLAILSTALLLHLLLPEVGLLYLRAAAIGAMFPIGVYACRWFTAQVSRGDEVVDTSVQALEGAVHCFERRPSGNRGSRLVRFYVELAGREFRVAPEACHAFVDGRRYRIYFVDAPIWSPVVSAEPAGP